MTSPTALCAWCSRPTRHLDGESDPACAPGSGCATPARRRGSAGRVAGSEILRLTYSGRTQTVTAWAIELGINPCTLHARLKAGWSVERALTAVGPQPRGRGPAPRSA